MAQSVSPLTDLWFIRRPRAQARWRLFCFPYAGGGSAIYRNWATQLPESIEVCAVQLPGREKRLREIPFTALPELVAALATAMAPLLDRPFAFFGHSMGALLSFELARVLRETQAPQPKTLLLSGHRAPTQPPRMPPIADFSDPDFFNALRELNGTPAELLANAEFMQLMLPMLRADFTLCARYAYVPGAPLACPFSVFGGLQDRGVPREDITPWRELTTGPTTFRMLPGDHFFLNTAPALLLQAVAQDLLRLG